MKKFLISFILLSAVLLTSCTGKLPALESLTGNYGSVSFEIADELETYIFTEDMFTEATESSLHANAQLIVSGKIKSIDEIKVDVNMPSEQLIPAEESDTGEDEIITLYYPVTAYLQVITLEVNKKHHGECNGVIRFITRVSSRLWDRKAIPLEVGDIGIFYLQSSKSDHDIMEVYDRQIAEYILYDSYNGVIKNTDGGYIFGKAQEFIISSDKNTEKYTPDTEKYEKLKKFYGSYEEFVNSTNELYFAKDIDEYVENNIRYYYDK